HDSRCHFQIGHAISNDGKNWTKDFTHNPILIKGLPGDWDDSFVYCPIVWKENSTWYMVYTGSGHNKEKQVGLATALHPEGPWIKNTNNPIVHVSDFGWDSHEVEGWGLLKVGQTYHLWYDTVTPPRKIGLAISTDLINWEKDKNNPIFGDGRFCVCPFKRGSYYYLIVPHYTLGTDYTEFELYIDINPTFYPDNRKLIKIVKTCSTSGWDDHDEDCPYILTTDIKRDTFVNNELWMYYSGERNGVWKEGLVIEKDIDNAIKV
ncbi:MAG TPA: hypothetical protein C5S37_06515, partial [Methanophagales archaeon]|nr:hypothetical protein [Methanophagales archaeon]